VLERLRARTERVIEQLIGGRIAWEFTIRLMLCTGIAAVASEVLPAVAGPTGWCSRW